MPMALILSSHVAASRVGGGVSQRALEAQGVDTALAPTVIFGRHPGWGAPGGAAVEEDVFKSVLEGLADHGLIHLSDLVLTGYFGSTGQVERAADVIDAVREAPRQFKWANGIETHAWSKQPFIVVDPILGDAPDGLYLPKTRALAIRDTLIPRADLITPNAFELGWLTGRPIESVDSAVRAARALAPAALISSMPCGPEIGVLYVDQGEALLVSHARMGKVPNGTGDLLTAAFSALIVNRTPAKEALERAVSLTRAVLEKAALWRAPELPLIACSELLRDPPRDLTAEPA